MTMTTITFANNQKELDRKIEQITQDHERLNPESTVEISYLDPKLKDIHFLPHQTIQLLIGIRIVEKENDDK
ncbi:hypothetical protein CVD25_15595 [Bacillus canaveralius]|uniref:Uncharacterized protein n=1 Tax=Bacillus canaveralius TaxID=1403243 RepID=A0A2N5GQQ6_9BACI|nr:MULTISPECIES: hypothetical protein [Bacillus]PLR83187.1 hypothetical protein CVD23_15145 [Bacillus sp. V33-4]PLR85387.1 hypothetical protein CU635_04105 [Bacillus canaveralius]PLR94978.1 hypothetical protein CVD25_15595 [Bacillus canaveralius]RSK48162.1 hypothetical protein EJA13_17330 [Bacillus canaveralius]